MHFFFCEKMRCYTCRIRAHGSMGTKMGTTSKLARTVLTKRFKIFTRLSRWVCWNSRPIPGAKKKLQGLWGVSGKSDSRVTLPPNKKKRNCVQLEKDIRKVTSLREHEGFVATTGCVSAVFLSQNSCHEYFAWIRCKWLRLETSSYLFPSFFWFTRATVCLFW